MAALGLASSSYAANQPSKVALTISITGDGVVRLSSGQQVACTGQCHKALSLRAESRIVLDARPASGWKFTGWIGCRAIVARVCGLYLTHPITVEATFAAPGTYTNPIPLATTAAVNPGANPARWTLRVVRSELRGRHLIVQITVALTAVTGPETWLIGTYAWIFLDGPRHHAEPVGRCIPPVPDFSHLGGYPPPIGSGVVGEGQILTGNLCYPIDDERPQALFVEPATQFPPPEPIQPPPQPSARAVWFALR
jgi:hypothetical protein